MFCSLRVAVVVPAYNEAALIEDALRSVPSYVDDVVVVDDASHDATATRAESVGDARVRVVRHRLNRGVGAAIATGYRAAFAARADVAVVMAGDAQMDPADLDALLEPVAKGDADYAKGDRLSHPHVVRRMPLFRLLGNHALTQLTRWSTGLAIRDSQCGYTALSRRAAARIDLDALWPRYGYPNDLLSHLAVARVPVRDVTVRPVYEDEVSGIRPADMMITFPRVLLRCATRRARTSAREGFERLALRSTR